jgi:hypothetical protein
VPGHNGHRSLECDVRCVCAASHAVGMGVSVGQVTTNLPTLGCAWNFTWGRSESDKRRGLQRFNSGNAFDGEPWKPTPCKKHHGCSLYAGDARSWPDTWVENEEAPALRRIICGSGSEAEAQESERRCRQLLDLPPPSCWSSQSPRFSWSISEALMSIQRPEPGERGTVV